MTKSISDIDGEKIALLSTFFLATSFWHINFSRIGLRAIVAPFFLVWSLYFFLSAIRNINAVDRIRYPAYSLIAGIFFGLGFYSYISYRIIPLLYFVVWFAIWMVNRRKDYRKKLVHIAFYLIGSGGLMIVPLVIYFLYHPKIFIQRATAINIFNSVNIWQSLGLNLLKTAAMFNFVGDNNWRHNYASRPELFWPVGILFILGIILGLFILIRNLKESMRSYKYPNTTVCIINAYIPYWFLFAWLIITAIPEVISNEGIPHALRTILMIPPTFIITGFGGVWCYNRIIALPFYTSIFLKRIITGLIGLFLCLLIIETYTTYFILWGQDINTRNAFTQKYVAIANKLKKVPQTIPKYIVVIPGGVNVKGIPMSAQTVMFLTDTYTVEKQKNKNFHYILPNEVEQIPNGSYVTVID